MALDTSNTGVLINLSQDLPLGATRYFFNGNDNDSADAKEIVAAPGVGRKLILTKVILAVTAGQELAILDGASTVLYGPTEVDPRGGPHINEFKYGLSLTTNTAMYVDSDTDAKFSIYIEYIDAPA